MRQLSEEKEDFSSCHSETLTAAVQGNCDCSESLLFLYCWQDPEQLEK